MTKFAAIATLIIATLTATTAAANTCKPGETFSYGYNKCVPEADEAMPYHLVPAERPTLTKADLPVRRLRTILVIGHTSSAGTADSDLQKQIKSPVWIAGGHKRTKRPTAVASKR